MEITLATIPAHMEKKPGSREALDSGCRCPAEENRYGKGCIGSAPDGDMTFKINKDCPLHGHKKQQKLRR